MISQTAEYALRAIVYLAEQGGVPRTNVEIARGTEVPAGYLGKVMQALSKAKIVNGQRGPHGGFTLRIPQETLSVLDVINVVDPIKRFPVCPLNIDNHKEILCPLHSKLDETAQLAEECFSGTTIADLLAVPKTRRPLCRFPIEAVAK